MSLHLISTTDPAVLKNTGVPIELVQTRNTGQATWEAHPEGVTSVYHVKFTTSRLMEMEGQYGTLADWEKALDTKVLETLVFSISIGLGGRGKGWPPARVAEALEFGKLKDYRLAVSAAYTMALGNDPKAVKEGLLRVEGDMATEPTETPVPALAGAPWPTDSASSTTTAASSGPTSGPAGWDTATTETSSGSSPQPSTPPSSNPWE